MRHKGNVPDIVLRQRAEPDGAVDTRIVEEVKVGAVLRGGGQFSVFNAGDARIVTAEERNLTRFVADRQCGVVHPVVTGDREQGGGAGTEFARHIRLKGKEPALVFSNQFPVQPDLCLVGHRAEAKHQAAGIKHPGHLNAALVVRPAVVVPQFLVLPLVIVAAGHSHQAGGRQRRGGVNVRTGKVMREAEIPKSVQFHAESRIILLRIKHTAASFRVFYQ